MKISEINKTSSYYNTPCSISHNDLDGYSSQGIVIQIFRKLFKHIAKIKTYNVGYDNLIPVEDNSQYRLYIITDLSISNENDAKKIIELTTTPKNIVIWIDHHQSSIDAYAKYPALKNIYGIRDTRGCATLLTWIFYQYIYLAIRKSPDHDPDMIRMLDEFSHTNFDEVLNYNSGHFGMIPEYIEYHPGMHSLPYGVELVDDYDRYVLNTRYSIYLNAVFGIHPKLHKNVNTQFFLKWLTSYDSNVRQQIIEICEVGRHASLWTRINDLKSLKSNGFIASFNNEKLKDIKMICINGSAYGSDAFGSLLNGGGFAKYDYACRYVISKNKCTYSIYYNGNNGMNAKEVCEIMGGGGHPGAAGFVTKNPVDLINTEDFSKDAIMTINDDITYLMLEVERMI